MVPDFLPYSSYSRHVFEVFLLLLSGFHYQHCHVEHSFYEKEHLPKEYDHVWKIYYKWFKWYACKRLNHKLDYLMIRYLASDRYYLPINGIWINIRKINKKINAFIFSLTSCKVQGSPSIIVRLV